MLCGQLPRHLPRGGSGWLTPVGSSEQVGQTREAGFGLFLLSSLPLTFR